MSSAANRYFSYVRKHLRPDGERLPLVFEATGVPAYYPSFLILDRRARNVASGTLERIAHDLIHFGQVLAFEGLDDVHVRFARGHYFNAAEIEAIAQTSSVTTSGLRRLNNAKVTVARRAKGFGKSEYVSNTVKHRRLSNFSDYLELVGRVNEAHAGGTNERRRRSCERQEMCEQLRELRPKVRSSRVRGKIPYQELGRVVDFVANAKPSDLRKIWPNKAIRIRNFAIITVLVYCGLREGELRQLRADDIDLNQCTLMVARRPDDPDDPRINEPNAKTSDRIIPLRHLVAERLESYILGPGSEVAESGGSPFLFLSDGNRSRGRPVGRGVVVDAVRDVGAHLGIPNLHPHALRSAWVQNLIDWAIENEIPQGELDRFANYLGGWSYFSKSASHYRGDHLTQKAYEHGLLVEKNR